MLGSPLLLIKQTHLFLNYLHSLIKGSANKASGG